ncbi:RNA polymerase sigma factor [Pelagicoccus sp. SDUM812002]|uniref:RNA polymerase sigma factor n=1 Tax=Pelagicoccus sp. SDUM812002 TaxID=3041266 RepID=UPI00280CBA48|nr:RNA polymerase sigma factor [Pelagicoccus sp. SDUM812002]MDQ8184493.1 RNA polymerase sigma factor [Pelagicoccus sp. SDUM812002]
MPSDSANDQELMRGLLKDAPGSLERIIERWQRPLYSFIYRYTQNEFATRDILQETFVRIYTKRHKYRFSYPLSSWVFTIAANLCKNKARWHQRHPETSIECLSVKGERRSRPNLLEVLPSEDDLPIDAIERDEDLGTLKNAVAGLPHDLRTAVLLHHYQDLSYKEISDIVGCSTRGVETRLYRARKLLRTRLAEARSLEESAQKKTAQPKAETVGPTCASIAL